MWLKIVASVCNPSAESTLAFTACMAAMFAQFTVNCVLVPRGCVTRTSDGITPSDDANAACSCTFHRGDAVGRVKLSASFMTKSPWIVKPFVAEHEKAEHAPRSFTDGHDLPPLIGGRITTRTRFLVPNPHDFEQRPQLLHCDTTQSPGHGLIAHCCLNTNGGHLL